MLFNSFQFLCFFPIVTFLYFVFPPRARNFFLLLASCFFYAAFIPKYLWILFFTIVIDYFAGIFIENASPRHKKKFLAASLVANIGVLALFKYYGFLSSNLSWLINFPVLNFILPIGLSFHTFQAMSYTIEVYRGNQRSERNFILYALYVMFYPQLVAGPIERPQNLLHQFKETHRFEIENLLDGLRLMFWGLIKKILIADRLAVIVNHVYAQPNSTHGLPLLLSLYFFSVQIYCDFSGYSDIARGAAKVMGFDLMLNFRTPYFSKSLSEFWTRWHISLSTWFKDYLYFPLGGNRVSNSRWAFNILFVFMISGFWHGASWTFVAWGTIHGLGLILEKKIQPSLFLTFQWVSLAWVFFRAETFAGAYQIFQGLLNWHDTFTIKQFGTLGVTYFEFFLDCLLVSLLFFIELMPFKQVPNVFRWASYYAAFILLILFGKFSQTQFIYFQF